VSEAIGIGMIGCGTVGSGVARLLRDQAEAYAQRVGRPIELKRVLVRDATCPRDGLDRSLLTDDPADFFATETMPIVIEVAGGIDPVGDYVRQALQSGRHVVTANKALLAEQGPALFKLARDNHVSIAFEAACAAGIPCVTALQFGLMANRIRGMYGILNGTCNYILTAMTRHDTPYAKALEMAQDKGYAEADPTLDVSGADAGQKLTILASLAFGVQLDGQQVHLCGIDGLNLKDVHFGAELGYDIKLLAIAERQDDGSISASVEPCFIHSADLLSPVIGPYNALVFEGDAVGASMLYGEGAGQGPTASAVVSDLLNVAAGWYNCAFGAMAMTPDCFPTGQVAPREELTSRFYLRVNALDVPGTMAKVTDILGQEGISLSAVLQHEDDAGQFVPVVINTHQARRGDVQNAIEKIKQLDAIEGEPVMLRIVDMPEDESW
jgi:homoserine dehydrogenase